MSWTWHTGDDWYLVPAAGTGRPPDWVPATGTGYYDTLYVYVKWRCSETSRADEIILQDLERLRNWYLVRLPGLEGPQMKSRLPGPDTGRTTKLTSFRQTSPQNDGAILANRKKIHKIYPITRLKNLTQLSVYKYKPLIIYNFDIPLGSS